MQLSEDLKSAVGEPFLLFRASDNPNVSELNGHPGAYVTDGPFLYREDDKVNMIWSSAEDHNAHIALPCKLESAFTLCHDSVPELAVGGKACVNCAADFCSCDRTVMLVQCSI